MTSETALGRGAGERRRIPTRVGSLAVRVVGDGPPAVLWHSLLVDERSWHRVEEALAGYRRRVMVRHPSGVTPPGSPARVRPRGRRCRPQTFGAR
jgi:hypothetical protein